MNKKLLSFLTCGIALALTACVFSCKKESSSPDYGPDPTKGYYPISVGKYILYNVDSTIWDDFNCTVRTNKYQMRYEVADTFRDNEDRLSYTIQAKIRVLGKDEWQAGTVFYVTPTDNSIEAVQTNMRFIKLIFPVTENISWKGNSKLPSDDQDFQYFVNWTYQYKNVGQSFKVDDDHTYDKTVTVNEADEKQNDPDTMPDAFAYKTYSQEVYAYDIGMVYRVMTHWVYDPGVARCRKGYSVEMRAIDHN